MNICTSTPRRHWGLIVTGSIMTLVGIVWAGRVLGFIVLDPVVVRAFFPVLLALWGVSIIIRAVMSMVLLSLNGKKKIAFSIMATMEQKAVAAMILSRATIA